MMNFEVIQILIIHSSNTLIVYVKYDIVASYDHGLESKIGYVVNTSPFKSFSNLGF
jgi:hypothetical protein